MVKQEWLVFIGLPYEVGTVVAAAQVAAQVVTSCYSCEERVVQ